MAAVAKQVQEGAREQEKERKDPEQVRPVLGYQEEADNEENAGQCQVVARSRAEAHGVHSSAHSGCRSR